MRLAKIELSWFRGAGAEVALPLNGGSAVVFGTNGAGKSSFVDGVEACMCGGKVAHLSHEYSGRAQEKGLVNTHRPEHVGTKVAITLDDQTSAVLVWTKGVPVRTDNSGISNWDYRRTILRQEEMAEFIRASKTDKYSAILPLLGLGHLELAAENLRKVRRETDALSKLEQMRQDVAAARQRRREVFGEADGATILGIARDLRQKYGVELGDAQGAAGVEKIVDAIKAKLATFDAQSRQAAALQELSATDVAANLLEVRGFDSEIAKAAEPLVKERLEVLSASRDFANALPPEASEIECPACGATTTAALFGDHVAVERAKLEEVDALFNRRREAVSTLCDKLAQIKGLLDKRDLDDWRTAHAGGLEDALQYLAELPFSKLRSACSDADLDAIEANISAIAAVVQATGGGASPDAQALIDDQTKAAVVAASMRAGGTRAKIERVEALNAFTSDLEVRVREEINAQASAVFGAISADIQRLWAVLQPGDKITEVRLHVPQENHKAIEVHLRFHGVDQDSPRLTLSEGQRNALGLCIFLAMAKQSSSDQPIILDDVVVSMDRGHRSNVVLLLQQELADRQVILFTHDREWFFELQRRLAKPHWKFFRLWPFADPETGIRLADEATDFAKARAKVGTDPEDALSNVRRMMDVALSEIAERLEVPVPHARGDDNDHRTGGELLLWINRRAGKAFRIKDGEDYKPHDAAIAALKTLPPDMAIWANRGTHTFSAAEGEAEKTIDKCEAILGHFECTDCSTSLGSFRKGNGDLECRCGKLRWKSN